MIRVYLALQEFKDGRVMFRRWSLDTDKLPGGLYQKQDVAAFRWFMSQSWNFEFFPLWHDDFMALTTEEDMRNVVPFEVLE